MAIKVVRVLRENWHEERKFIGTAFFVNKNTLITAKHVVEDYLTDDYKIYLTEMPNGGNVLISTTQIELCPRDTAVIKTKREYSTVSAVSYFEGLNKGIKVNIQGFHDEDGEECSYESPVSGYLNAHHTFEIQDSRTNGLSGSPVIVDGKICGIAQAISPEKNITYIIPISEVCDKTIFEQESVEEFNNQLLKDMVHELDYDIAEFKKISYTVLPTKPKIVLSNSVDKIIDEIAELRDVNNSKNIPILCLAKKLYTIKKDNRIIEWKETVYPNYNFDDLECILNNSAISYNILVEVIVNDKNSKNATIQIWEDKLISEGQVLTEGKHDYQVVRIKDVNLKESQDMMDFVDDFMSYLNSFDNPEQVYLEFVLPSEILDEDIRKWQDNDENFLAEEYNFIYRLQDRFVNYFQYHKRWKPYWENVFVDNKDKAIDDCSFLLDSESDKAKINKSSSGCMITKFPIYETDVFKRIYKFGISLLISPDSSLTEDELEKFNNWCYSEFKDKPIKNLVTEVNRLQGSYPNEFKSKIMLILDNPNRVPLQYQKPQIHQYK